MILPVMISGFNLQTLSLVLGAISFGIGFGLRNIADNFFQLSPFSFQLHRYG